MTDDSLAEDRDIAATRIWLERAVIGLGLCPFARAVHVGRRIRYVVAPAGSEDELLVALERELLLLAAADIGQIETTLLIHPGVLQEFHDYNAFLDRADRLLQSLDLDGELQIASFHPQYQFADAAADDVANCSNRSPFPLLHLLREESVDRAVAAFPEAERIYERNIDTLRALGWDGWMALWGKSA